MTARHARTRHRVHVRTAARSRARIRFEEQVDDIEVPDDPGLEPEEVAPYSSDR